MDEKILALFERLVIAEERKAAAQERLADAAEVSTVENEERWYPENYNHEEDENE